MGRYFQTLFLKFHFLGIIAVLLRYFTARSQVGCAVRTIDVGSKIHGALGAAYKY